MASPVDELGSWHRRVRLRRRRMGLSLAQVAAETNLSIGWLSLIERGLRTPTPEAAATIQEALGMVDPVAMPAQPSVSDPAVDGTTDQAMARLGAALAVTRQVKLDDLARATDMSLGDVRYGLQALSERLEPLGMRIIDDGMTADLQPHEALAAVASYFATPRPKPALTSLQMQVLAMAIYHDEVTVDQVSDLRGVESWRVVHTLVEKGYLRSVRDSTAYQPTSLVLALFGVRSFEVLKAALQPSVDQLDDLFAARTELEQPDP